MLFTHPANLVKFAIPPFLLVGLSLCAAAQEPPKTNSSAPVDSGLLGDSPFIYNGLVFTDEARGSGFVAENPRTFFTAAHVVSSVTEAGEFSWGAPPVWVGGYSGAAQPSFEGAVASRGYFRWTQYAAHVAEYGVDSRPAFARDVALAWGLEDFLEGEPAGLDYKGLAHLRKPNLSMITGYPAELDYTGESGGYFLHSTEPDLTPFRMASKSYLFATHISTGPGNSGGPVWSQDDSGTWKAAGILVAGRPSEAGIYVISPSVRSFLKAAVPVTGEPRKASKGLRGVGTGTAVLVMKKPRKIPDGLHRWTKIPLKSIKFPEGSKVVSAELDLEATTGHRGDLIVRLVGPDGTFATVHNGEGAGEDDLLIEDLDLSEVFGGASSVGNWQVLVQDRLTGDPTVVTKVELEIVSEETGSSSGT